MIVLKYLNSCHREDGEILFSLGTVEAMDLNSTQADLDQISEAAGGKGGQKNLPNYRKVTQWNELPWNHRINFLRNFQEAVRHGLGILTLWRRLTYMTHGDPPMCCSGAHMISLVGQPLCQIQTISQYAHYTSICV